jgi:hypothetical protein
MRRFAAMEWVTLDGVYDADPMDHLDGLRVGGSRLRYFGKVLRHGVIVTLPKTPALR